jgi:lysophospholipase L1-like esterase
MTRRTAAMVLVCSLWAVSSCATLTPASSTTHGGWVTAWGASPEPPPADVPSLDNRTVRLIVHTELSGDKVRIRLSNRYGTAPLVIDAAYVGLRGSGASLAGDNHVVTFSGFKSITIPAAALTLSDPVDLAVPPGADLAISVHIAQSAGVVTIHALPLQKSFISAAGDFAAQGDAGPFAAPLEYLPYLANVELHAVGAHAIVAFGDSITDGYLSTSDANHRWPDHLARRLRAAGKSIAVVNQGISGNRLLRDATAAIPYFGRNGLSRFDSDVLVTSGITHIVVLIGINDIGQPGARQGSTEQVSVDDLIAGYRQLISRAHAQGIKVIGATLTPFDTFNAAPGYFSAEGEAKRQALNTWIRNGKEFDGVIDFDVAVRDPEHPSKFLPAYDSGDHLHPGDAGYKAMGEAIDLSLFN